MLQFNYVMPKLYQNLNEFKVIFQRLKDIKITHSANPAKRRQEQYNKLINSALIQLGVLIQLVEDKTEKKVKVKFNKSHMNLSEFIDNVYSQTALFNEEVVFRDYGNALEYWNLELKCWYPTKKMLVKCNKYEKFVKRRLQQKLKKG